jgi:hypothetical protein
MLLASARCQTITDWFKSSWRAVWVDVSVSLVVCSPLQLTLALRVPTLLLQARGPPTAALGTTALADGEDWPLAEVLAGAAEGHQAHHEGDCRPLEHPLCGTEEDVAATSSAAARARASAGQARCPGQQRPFCLAEVWRRLLPDPECCAT